MVTEVSVIAKNGTRQKLPAIWKVEAKKVDELADSFVHLLKFK